MCTKPKISSPAPVTPAAPPPPAEKTVDSLDLNDEFRRKYQGTRNGMNQLKIKLKE